MHLIRELLGFFIKLRRSRSLEQNAVKEITLETSWDNKNHYILRVIYYTLLYSKFLCYLVPYQVLYMKESS